MITFKNSTNFELIRLQQTFRQFPLQQPSSQFKDTSLQQ